MMTARLTPLFLFAFLPSAALADWQMTRWGMSFEEVLRAVPEATPNENRGLDTGSTEARIETHVVAPWTAGGISFIAAFGFAADADELVLVRITPVNLDHCPMIQRNLTWTYGPEQHLTDQGFLKSLTWWDQGNGNLVAYTVARSILERSSPILDCNVTYRPIPVAGAASGF